MFGSEFGWACTWLAAPVGSEYIALAVHQAARVSAVAHGGQVVLSEQAAGEDGARDVGLAALGGHRVRDFERPVRLFQLVAPGLRRKFPAVRAVPADQHNLVVPLTLIGRDRDAAALEAALTEHRLLTVVGTGGVGKSRLVTEVGLRVAASWPSGVWLVDCSPLEDSVLPRRPSRAPSASPQRGLRPPGRMSSTTTYEKSGRC